MAEPSIRALAYLGDAVFEILVREKITLGPDRTVKRMNESAKKWVAASAQAAMCAKISPLLSGEEADVLRRGRNVSAQSRPKKTPVTQYREATGLEALFGWLHARGETARARFLFNICVTENEES
ncbi:MAG: ribonuclease III [Clostridiales bacterium]|jgi:ribonuclease-3 family protein|nr:ribonuclease III [Clostridiales bacterium]